MVTESPKDNIAIINVAHAVQTMAGTALEIFGSGLQTDPDQSEGFSTIVEEFS